MSADLRQLAYACAEVAPVFKTGHEQKLREAAAILNSLAEAAGAVPPLPVVAWSQSGGDFFTADPAEAWVWKACPVRARGGIVEYVRKADADAALASLQARLDAAERDAARYRWLRDDALDAGPYDDGRMVWCVIGPDAYDCNPCDGSDLDAAIDAATSQESST